MQTSMIQDGFGTVFTAEGAERVDAVPTESIINAIKETGLVLFQGFGTTRDEFDETTARVGGTYMNYKGGGYVRKTEGEEKNATILSTSTTLAKGKVVPLPSPCRCTWKCRTPTSSRCCCGSIA